MEVGKAPRPEERPYGKVEVAPCQPLPGGVKRHSYFLLGSRPLSSRLSWWLIKKTKKRKIKSERPKEKMVSRWKALDSR